MKTGEGKSITLAISSIMFAFLGFHVDCACYSKLLSQRDYDDFIKLFQEFGFEDKIKYSTFDELFENIIHKDYNVREIGQNILENELDNYFRKK